MRLLLLKLITTYAAERALKILGKLIPRRTGCDPALRIALFSSSYSNPQTLHTYFIFLSPYLVIIDYSFSWLGNRFCRVAGWAMMPAAIRFDEYADHRSSCSISLCSAARQSGQIPLIDRPMANAAVARLCRDMLVKLMAVFGGCVTHVRSERRADDSAARPSDRIGPPRGP